MNTASWLLLFGRSAALVDLADDPATVGLGASNPTTTLGPITITPAAASLGMGASGPTVVLGPITVTPPAASLGLGASSPTVLLGPVTVTPDPIAVAIAAGDPITILGAITIAPAVGTTIMTAAPPTVVLGPATVLPAAAAAALGASDPVVVLGGVVVAPPSAATALAGADPTTIEGPITITPAAASVGLDATAPAVVLGPTTVAPATAAVGLGASDPLVSTGVLVTPPAASLGLGAASPSVTLGPVTLSPPAAPVGLSAADPALVLGAVTAAPPAASLGLDATSPAVVAGPITIVPPVASAGLMAGSPIVELGPIVIVPAAGAVGLEAGIPAVILGPTSVSPAVASVALGASDPIVIASGPVTVTPPAASVGLTAGDPFVEIVWPLIRDTQVEATVGRLILLEDGDQERDDAGEIGPLADYIMRPIASVPIILAADATTADYAAAFDEAYQRIVAAVGQDSTLGGLVAGVEIGLVARGVVRDEESGPPLGALEVEFEIEFEHTDRLGARRRVILEALATALAANVTPPGASQWEAVLARIAMVVAATLPSYAFIRNPDVPIEEGAGDPGTVALLDGTLAPTGNAPTGAEDWAASCQVWLALEGDEATMAATRADVWDALRGALRTDTVLAGLIHRLTDEQLDDVVPLLDLGPTSTAFGLGIRAEFLTEEYDPAALAA